jgi:hypothetical protein
MKLVENHFFEKKMIKASLLFRNIKGEVLIVPIKKEKEKKNY